MTSDIGGDLVGDLLSEIIAEVLQEAIPGGIASFVPFLGGFIAAGIDMMVATTLTWRVGTMLSIYYQNNSSWVVDRKNTYARAKRMVGGLS